MKNTRALHRKHTSALIAIALSVAACSESYRPIGVQNPVPAVEAALEISDMDAPVGATFTVSVRAVATQGTVGSFTARIGYDPAAVRFDAEIPSDDAAMRAINPSWGLLRIAGATASGFAAGRLASYRFVALRAKSASSLSLAVDEMHLITHFDARPSLTIAPTRVIAR